jgi:hypothetical protein
MENSIKIPQKTKNRTTYAPALPFLGLYQKECKSFTPTFISILFTTAKPGKQPRCPTTDKWIKKM